MSEKSAHLGQTKTTKNSNGYVRKTYPSCGTGGRDKGWKFSGQNRLTDLSLQATSRVTRSNNQDRIGWVWTAQERPVLPPEYSCYRNSCRRQRRVTSRRQTFWQRKLVEIGSLSNAWRGDPHSIAQVDPLWMGFWFYASRSVHRSSSYQYVYMEYRRMKTFWNFEH